MDELRYGLVEESAIGANTIDRSWMTTFWETFADCVFEIDAQYRVVSVLKKADSTLTMSGLVGGSFLNIAVEKDRAFVESELDLLKNPDISYRRFTFLSKLGRYYRMTLVGQHEDGVFTGLRGIAVDVTEQSLKEITLNWQRAIIEGSSDFISIADTAGHVLYTNPGAYTMTGNDPATGALPPDLYTPEHAEAVNGEGLDKAVKDGSWTGLGELIRADGTRIAVEHTMFSVKNEQDGSVLIATTIRDITVFVEARKAAEAANMAKSEFLSRMSHEIRTPMNAIIGMTQIAQGTSDEERIRSCLGKIDGASKHLLALINDILDISKIEANKLELQSEIFELAKCVNNIRSMIAVRVEEKDQVFDLRFSETLPRYLLGDELRFTQVIINLLGNAIKFTPEKGSISLDIHELERVSGECVLEVQVSDSGIGITPEHQDKLFAPFEQGDGSITREYGGTGLGLAICKYIVELMGGGIRVDSVMGRGSVFTFTVRIRIGDGAAVEWYETPGIATRERRDPGAAIAGIDDLGRFTVLLVEDVEINREIVFAMLEDTHIRIDCAENGARAVEMFAASPDRYDLILMDMQMPVMDGLEATRRIRAMDVERAQEIAIVAMTANVFREDIDKCKAAGMNDHIAKPIDSSQLLEKLSNYLFMSGFTRRR